MDLVIITQEDSFFIPKNIKKINEVADIKEIVVLDSKGSLSNKISDFLKWFGFFQVSKMGLKLIKRKTLDFLDNIFSYKILKGEGSIKSFSKKERIPFQIIDNVNDSEFISHLKKIAPDIIISFSAPQVIKEELLSLPKHGCINLHGSFLPYYRGLLPSFWVLHDEAEYAGATVHYMSEKIDDGSIINQQKIPIEGCKTMFEVMEKTKGVGGELMIKTIKELEAGKAKTKRNNIKVGNYYTWPDKEAAQKFKSKGYKLI